MMFHLSPHGHGKEQRVQILAHTDERATTPKYILTIPINPNKDLLLEVALKQRNGTTSMLSFSDCVNGKLAEREP